VEYGPAGFTPGTDATAGAGGTIWTGGPVAASPVTITGLSANTAYSVYVRQECTPGTLYSVNTLPTNFTTACGGASCNYTVRIGDIWGDGWDGTQWELRQNGVTLVVLGPQLAGCGPVDVPVSICAGSVISLHWTVGGSFQDEKALQLINPFGVVVYDFRGTSGSANCPGVNWTSANNTSPGSFPALMFSGTSSCTPPACVQPATVSASSVTGTSADVNWTCTSCTGVFHVEYGASGFTPGTGATAGTGTMVPGGPFVAGPVSISGLSGSTAYTVVVRQECTPGVFSDNTATSFTTGIDCATAPVLACGVSTSVTLSGPGTFDPSAAGGGPYSTPGQERLWSFTAPNAGTYTLNVTTASFGTFVDYFFKAAPSACDQTGWTFIRDFFGTGTQDFTIPAAGTYYILADEESTLSVSQTFNITCPLPCATPTALFLSDVTSVTATANWTCASCTGSQFFVEVGAPGFIPGTGNTAGGGTVYGPFATSPGAITGLVPTTSYEVYVRQDCNNVGDAYSNNRGPVFFTTLAPPPANDVCANAIPVACGDVITGSNVAATSENLPSQAAGGETTVDNGVWYVYTPTVTGEQVTASLCAGTSFDTRIHIFQGSCASPVGVAGADDVCGVQSTITWNALPGNTYYIVVEGYFSSSGTFQMTISCGPLCNPLVTNDLCINAQAITMDPNCVPFGGNLSCATNTAGANPSCVFNTFGVFNDAYYTFQATAPDAFVTLTNGGTANLHFVIYNGVACDISAPNQVYCSAAVTSGAPTLVTGLTTGNFYTMRVMQLATGAGPFTLCVQKLDISDIACAPVALACGDLRFGRTVGRANNLPAGACPFNGAASTGGVNFFSYTAAADEDVTFSLCGQTNFDTRLSVFSGACTALVCNVMNDDAAGCPGGGSEVTVRAVNGQTYTVMVHGAGALEGTYQLSVFCNPYCSITEANDRCANSITVGTSIIGDGTLPSVEQQACSYADAPTACSGASMVQGVWFDFATGPNTLYDVFIGVNSTDPNQYTAPNMNIAVYSGACSGVGASGEVFCANNCNGSTSLPPLVANSNYRLLVYNAGGTAQGTFGLLVSHPGFNDAGISAILAPSGTVCDAKLFPQVYLKNFGENPLTSAQIISRIDGNIVQTYNWSGPGIPRGDSVLVTLPLVTSPFGPHAYTAETAQPNGQPDDLVSNNASTSSYDATGQTVKVVIRADNNGGQISWTVFDAFFFPIAQDGPNTYLSNQEKITSHCLPTTLGNCFYFFMFDGGGDGLCCLSGTGSWELRDVLDRTILRDNGEFLSQSPSLSPVNPGYFAHEFCLPLGPSAPLAGECGVYNNLLQNKVFANTVTGATNYQFEFSDPDKGFRRRIALPRNWVKFGEMVTNPLTFGTTYFCRVRVDQGATGFSDDFFGAGCEMAMAAAQPTCTELISTPGNTFSCGVTKAFGGSDKVYAVPVPYATQYRFNFSAPGEGYNRNIVRPSYVCLLSWATLPLVNGSTYDVRVEAFVSGTWTGFCGATCQVTIANPAVNGANDGRAPEVVETGNVQLWPNPVRDGRVNLMIGELTDATQQISVDVYDVFGKRVMSQHFENAGEVFNTVLDLNNGVAAGVYNVSITINERVYTQRLSVQ
jgi:hypothetical protein